MDNSSYLHKVPELVDADAAFVVSDEDLDQVPPQDVQERIAQRLADVREARARHLRAGGEFHDDCP